MEKPGFFPVNDEPKNATRPLQIETLLDVEKPGFLSKNTLPIAQLLAQTSQQCYIFKHPFHPLLPLIAHYMEETSITPIWDII